MHVFTGQSNVYLVRERNHIRHSRPSDWLMLSCAADLFVVSLLATKGILMAAIPWSYLVSLLIAVLAFTFFADNLKIHVFGYFRVR
jgi:hypothetical protein